MIDMYYTQKKVYQTGQASGKVQFTAWQGDTAKTEHTVTKASSYHVNITCIYSTGPTLYWIVWVWFK